MQSTEGLAGRIRKIFSLDPSRNAIEFQSQWFTWGQLTRVMEQLEGFLAGQSQGKGAAVGVMLRNRPGHFAAMMQVLISERCLVPINPLVGVGKLVEEIEKLRTPVLVADVQDWAIPEVRAAAERVGCMGLAIGGDGMVSIAVVPGLEKVGAGPHHEAMPGVAINMLTSGTTGPAKRIKLYYKNLESGLLGALFYESGGGGEPTLKDSMVIVLSPFVHMGGVWGSVSAVVAGRGIALLEKFSIPEWHRTVLLHKPKLVAMPPTAIRMILDANIPREDLASIIAVRSSTAPLDPDLKDAFEAHYNIPILDTYGATEFNGGVAGWTLADHKKFGNTKRGSVGRAQPGCELRIADQETGEALPAGKIGLLEVRAPHVAKGEWVRTTDLAELDADGFLYMRGRADDAIIRGGFKVLPADVVDMFKRHPAVLDASVVGLPDERLGAVPVAAVELRSGATATPEELLAYAREHLTSYQVPVALKIVDALPRTPSMKVAQPAVRELFQESK
jgi:acyl-CoA synthetase (AMP-forming)/AMP-acid ligase II